MLIIICVSEHVWPKYIRIFIHTESVCLPEQESKKIDRGKQQRREIRDRDCEIEEDRLPPGEGGENKE